MYWSSTDFGADFRWRVNYVKRATCFISIWSRLQSPPPPWVRAWYDLFVAKSNGQVPMIKIDLHWKVGTAAAQWLRCCATNWKVFGSFPAGVSGFFIDIKSFRSHCGPGVDSASNRNEYQGHLLGGKGDRCVRLTNLPPSCAVVMKSENLNCLEPSGPLRACFFNWKVRNDQLN